MELLCQCGTLVSDTGYDRRIGWIWQVSCEEVISRDGVRLLDQDWSRPLTVNLTLAYAGNGGLPGGGFFLHQGFLGLLKQHLLCLEQGIPLRRGLLLLRPHPVLQLLPLLLPLLTLQLLAYLLLLLDKDFNFVKARSRCMRPKRSPFPRECPYCSLDDIFKDLQCPVSRTKTQRFKN
jgi:hypothetical protein